MQVRLTCLGLKEYKGSLKLFLILLNGEIIGQPDTPTIFRSQSERAKGYDTQGTLESWQANVAKYADKNPLMMLEQKSKWLDRLPDDASPQVQRVAGRFAVLETALQLAKHLTRWDNHTNSEAFLHCFNEWINEFGLHSREEKQVIEQVNGWLLRNGARFIEFPFNPSQNEPRDTAGYKELSNDKDSSDRFWVYPQVYIQDVIAGFNEKQASEILANIGMLSTSKAKGYKYKKPLPRPIAGNKTIRCYVLTVLDEKDEEQDDANTSTANR